MFFESVDLVAHVLNVIGINFADWEGLDRDRVRRSLRSHDPSRANNNQGSTSSGTVRSVGPWLGFGDIAEARGNAMAHS